MTLAIWPMIFRLLGRWPTGLKFQNDHCEPDIFSPPVTLVPNVNNSLNLVIEGFMGESLYGEGVCSILVDRCFTTETFPPKVFPPRTFHYLWEVKRLVKNN